MRGADFGAECCELACSFDDFDWTFHTSFLRAFALASSVLNRNVRISRATWQTRQHFQLLDSALLGVLPRPIGRSQSLHVFIPDDHVSSHAFFANEAALL